jgi:hypothetical protein
MGNLVSRTLIAASLVVITQPSAASIQNGTPQADSSVLQRYSLDEIDSAALLLRVTADGNASVLCRDIASEKARRLLLPMHALFEEKITLERGKLPLRGRRLTRANRCESNCHCGAYSTLLEGFAPQADLLAAVTKKAATQSAAESLACAKRNRWFCNSPLLNHLKSELRHY